MATNLQPYIYYELEDLKDDQFPDDYNGRQFLDDLADSLADEGNGVLVWFSTDSLTNIWENWEMDEENGFHDYPIEHWFYLNTLAEYLDENFGMETPYGHFYEAAFYYWY